MCLFVCKLLKIDKRSRGEPGESGALLRGPAPLESKPRSESLLELEHSVQGGDLTEGPLDRQERDRSAAERVERHGFDLDHAGGDENATAGKNAFISGHFSAMSRRLSERPMNGLPTEHEMFPRERSHMLRGILQRRGSCDAPERPRATVPSEKRRLRGGHGVQRLALLGHTERDVFGGL